MHKEKNGPYYKVHICGPVFVVSNIKSSLNERVEEGGVGEQKEPKLQGIIL